MKRHAFAILALLTLGPASARADLTLTIGNLALTPGGTGTVNVLIASRDGTPVNLNSFGFEFRITTVKGPDRLEFTQSQMSPFAGTSVPYVFQGNSYDQINSSPQGMVVAGTSPPSGVYDGFDGTNDGFDVAVGGARLLTELTVTTVTGLPPAVGDSFLISLVSDNSSFADSLGRNINYTSSGGLVTVVPTPNSAALAGLGGLTTGIICRVKFGLGKRNRRQFSNN